MKGTMLESRSAAAVSLSLAVALAALAAGCSKSDSTVTSPESMNSSISGTVLSGVGPGGLRPMAVGLANVTVRIVQTGASTVSSSSGDFTLSNVPSGPIDLQFDRADVNARGNVVVPAGSTVAVTVSIVGNKAVITSRGHAGAEIEGIVQSVNAQGSTLTVQDQRLGLVTVAVNTTTVIRHGHTTLALATIAAGNRVHVKAMQQNDGTYLATDVNVQSAGGGGETENEVSGTVLSVDAQAKSFVVQTASGNVTVVTDAATKFKRSGTSSAFADVTVGRLVDVEGTKRPDGSVLATEVEIEG